MKNELNNYKDMKQLNVYDNYKNVVVPKIELLDIFLKTNYTEFNEVVSLINNNINSLTALNQLLDIFELEKSYLEEIIYFLDKTYIDKDLILYLILNTNSYISGIIKREMVCGSPKLYSPIDISYIYDLDFNKVSKAFKFLNYTHITSKEIELILFQIN